MLQETPPTLKGFESPAICRARALLSAVEMLKRGITAVHDDAFFNRGNSKSAIKDYYGSIYDYTNAIEIDSSQSDVFINRGLSRQNIGDKEGACFDWEKASSLGDKDAIQLVRNHC